MDIVEEVKRVNHMEHDKRNDIVICNQSESSRNTELVGDVCACVCVHILNRFISSPPHVIAGVGILKSEGQPSQKYLGWADQQAGNSGRLQTQMLQA